ncbi:hypothetical protein [Enterococcus faecalis]|uniref:hypothetical protein n=1 Tax=Enterococcus faecalis TaxID=1351 RepID=UPI00032FB82B|nr:hypothetical protein [Enterococcus faecalis]EHL2501698.1 hypothetical protein [Enterococcus faecalis]EOJ96440.1 hypothetical protein WOK_02612 [Enterococcus faecalis EnGen0359]HAP5733957.1 hypothetical protein [Enterococcus faecalis]
MFTQLLDKLKNRQGNTLMSKENVQKKYHESLKERGITDIEAELIGRLYGVKLLDAEKKHDG